jgi:hypothetical protein
MVKADPAMPAMPQPSPNGSVDLASVDADGFAHDPVGHYCTDLQPPA